MKWLLRLLFFAAWGVSLVYMFGFGALVGMFSPSMAESAMVRSGKVLEWVTGGFTPCGETPPLECGFSDTTGRTEVDCDDYQGDGAAVLMTFGQSNSANAGRDRYIPVGPVANFNFHDDRCYLAEDPLLGPDAPGGSVWGVLGDKLIASGQYDRVLLIPFGIGGSSLGEWQVDGFLHPILESATAAVRERGITPTHVLWHQGESDAGDGTMEADYFAMFEALLGNLRDYGIDAPVYPAVATHCEMPYFEQSPDYARGRETVRAAQARLPELEGVFPGPDTDTIQGSFYRHDNCHFNAKGMQAHADLWLEALGQSPAGAP